MALLLRDIVGLSYNEIADSLEITLATVKWRIFKAREDVQLALAREGISFGSDAEAVRRCRTRSDPEVRGAAPAPAGARPRRISACVRAMSYVVRLNCARPASKSSSSQAARGSPSRGWPTEPGFSSQRAPARGTSLPPIATPPLRVVAVPGDRERDMAVADQHERRGRRLQAELRDVVAQDVLPDRVARAGVEELDAVAHGRRRQRLEPGALLGAEHGARPARRDPGVAGEVGEVDRAEHRRGRGCRRARASPGRGRAAALVRLRPVADDVAEAPDLVGRSRVDLGEHRLERVKVRVDVGDDCDAHGLVGGRLSSRGRRSREATGSP